MNSSNANEEVDSSVDILNSSKRKHINEMEEELEDIEEESDEFQEEEDNEIEEEQEYTQIGEETEEEEDEDEEVSDDEDIVDVVDEEEDMITIRRRVKRNKVVVQEGHQFNINKKAKRGARIEIDYDIDLIELENNKGEVSLKFKAAGRNEIDISEKDRGFWRLRSLDLSKFSCWFKIGSGEKDLDLKFTEFKKKKMCLYFQKDRGAWTPIKDAHQFSKSRALLVFQGLKPRVDLIEIVQVGKKNSEMMDIECSPLLRLNENTFIMEIQFKSLKKGLWKIVYNGKRTKKFCFGSSQKEARTKVWKRIL